MKIPKDVPTKVGDRVRQRGSDRTGEVAGYVRSMAWFRIKWDDGKGPMICHQNELQLTEKSS